MNAIHRRRAVWNGRTVFSAMLALLFCYGMVFVQLPYYIFQPGTADNLQSMVHVSGGGYPESGSFMLTTVGVTKTNMLKMIVAGLRSYDVRKIDAVRQGGESEEEYGERQHQIMLTSQANAVQAAYRAAGVPYGIKNAGVVVLQTLPDYPAYGILEPGDTLLRVDGLPISGGSDLTAGFSAKLAGESVMIQYSRGGVVMEAAFTLRNIPQSGHGAGPKASLGIGVVTGDLKTVSPEQSDEAVTIEAGDIGGPSAGLMFALQIYGLLLPEDLSKGYKIAGTGTIDPEGRIGAIGSIRHKVAAADREGAELFFTPKDQDSGLNATEAAEQAAKLGTGMKIVGVDTLDEAIRYLEQLPPKG